MVKVYAPISIGNIGVGFDLLGIAVTAIDNDNLLGDCIIIEHATVLTVHCTGRFSYQLPKELQKNIVFQCWEKFCKFLGNMYPMCIHLEKNVPVSSGLGSSACSIVATLLAINHHCGYLLDDNQLLILMGEIEGKISGAVHFDNVSPCFFGGMQLILQEFGVISQKIPIFDHWLWVLAYPGIQISTVIARSRLPEKYDRVDCINYGRCLSGFIHACHTNQEFLAISCMKDVIAEPYRCQLLPIQMIDLRTALIQKGALSCGISGAGPTIFALCNTQDIADSISCWLMHHYVQNSEGFVRICRVDNCGARIVTCHS